MSRFLAEQFRARHKIRPGPLSKKSHDTPGSVVKKIKKIFIFFEKSIDILGIV
jgi:hypothetical protein